MLGKDGGYGRAGDVCQVFQKDNCHDAEKRPQIVAETADHQHAKQQNRFVQPIRQLGADAALADRFQPAGNARQHRRHKEGAQLDAKGIDAQHLRRQIVVAHGDEGTPQLCAPHVDQHDSRDNQNRQRDVKNLRHLVKGDPCNHRRRHRNTPRRTAKIFWKDVPAQPRNNELCGQRRHRQVKALDAQRRQAKDQSNDAGAECSQWQRYKDRQSPILRSQRHDVAADKHERRLTKRNLPRHAGEDVEPLHCHDRVHDAVDRRDQVSVAEQWDRSRSNDNEQHRPTLPWLAQQRHILRITTVKVASGS